MSRISLPLGIEHILSRHAEVRTASEERTEDELHLVSKQCQKLFSHAYCNIDELRTHIEGLRESIESICYHSDVTEAEQKISYLLYSIIEVADKSGSQELLQVSQDLLHLHHLVIERAIELQNE